jgi:hypothetical protein
MRATILSSWPHNAQRFLDDLDLPQVSKVSASYFAMPAPER